MADYASVQSVHPGPLQRSAKRDFDPDCFPGEESVLWAKYIKEY